MKPIPYKYLYGINPKDGDENEDDFKLPTPDPNKDQNIDKTKCGEGGCD